MLAIIVIVLTTISSESNIINISMKKSDANNHNEKTIAVNDIKLIIMRNVVSLGSIDYTNTRRNSKRRSKKIRLVASERRSRN